MLRLKPFQQGYERQQIQQRMEEAHMDERVRIEPVHYSHISTIHRILLKRGKSKHTTTKPDLIRRQGSPFHHTP